MKSAEVKVSKNVTCIREAKVGTAIARKTKASHVRVHCHSSTENMAN